MPCVSAPKIAHGIRDDVFLAWLVADVEFELLEKLGRLHKPQIKPYCYCGGCNRGLLKNVKYREVIYFNDNV